MNFGAVIRKYRQEADLSQRELAREVGVTATYISHLENGRADPSISLFRKLASVFGMPAEVFFWEAVEIPCTATAQEREACEVAIGLIRSWKSAQAE